MLSTSMTGSNQWYLGLACAVAACLSLTSCSEGGRGAIADGGRDGMVDSGRDHINGDPDTGELGPDQCPLYAEGTCPAECTAIHGRKVDLEKECAAGPVVIDCTNLEGFRDVEDCIVSIATGEVYSLPFLVESGRFIGWEDCNESEQLAATNATMCP